MDPTLLWSSCSFHPPQLHHASAFVPSMWLSGLRSLPASSAALPQTPRSYKLVQGQQHWRKGRGLKRERVRENVCLLSPIRTRGRNIIGLQKEEVCLQYQHIIISLWSCDTNMCLNGANNFWHEKQACPSFTFCCLWVTKQICSHRVEEAVEIHSSPPPKAQTMHKTCQWFAWWAVMDGTQTLWGCLEYREL